MAKHFTHQIVAEAQELGLTNIEVINRKTKKMLIGGLPGGAKIKLIFKQRCGDPRAPKNAISDLRRAVRGSANEAAA